MRSGSFVYDVQLPLTSWQPSGEQLLVLSGMMRQLAGQQLPLRRLQLTAELALQLFADNEYKRSQVPSIAERSPTGECRVDGEVAGPPDSMAPRFRKSRKVSRL